MIKIYLVGLSVGALISVLMVSWLAPQSIGWYFEPPVEIGINCRPATEWAMSKLLTAQLIGLGMGGIIGILAAHFIAKKQGAQLN